MLPMLLFLVVVVVVLLIFVGSGGRVVFVGVVGVGVADDAAFAGGVGGGVTVRFGISVSFDVLRAFLSCTWRSWRPCSEVQAVDGYLPAVDPTQGRPYKPKGVARSSRVDAPSNSRGPSNKYARQPYFLVHQGLFCAGVWSRGTFSHRAKPRSRSMFALDR